MKGVYSLLPDLLFNSQTRLPKLKVLIKLIKWPTYNVMVVLKQHCTLVCDSSLAHDYIALNLKCYSTLVNNVTHFDLPYLSCQKLHVLVFLRSNPEAYT